MTMIEIKRVGKVLWWVVKLLLGFSLFAVIYALGQGVWGEFDQLSAPIRCCLPIVFTVLLLGCYAVIRRLVEKKWPSDLSLKRLVPDTGLGLGIGFGYFCIIVAIMLVIGSYRVGQWHAFNMDMFLMLIFFLMVATAEEIIFRGVLFRMVDKQLGTVVAYVISALLFGFMHYFQGTLWSSIAIAIEAGLMLAAAYKYTNTLWLPIGIHWAWNFTQGNIFGFMVSGTESGDSLIEPVIKGPDLITGGVFGAEASLIAVAIGAAISYYLIIKGKKAGPVQ